MDVKTSDQRPSVTSGVDPSDPSTTIRKLLKLVQVLQDERDALLRDSEEAATLQKATRELERLRIENNNIPILREENLQLRQQLREAGQHKHEGLYQENKKLKVKD